ncbi:hypothetical protein [Pseudomonas sp. NA-150]|uniref:hypothetical protein n=1 Tax=Pseudomonas sp. NA-150 TaxID=3367525 RepID=UPI0037C66902
MISVVYAWLAILTVACVLVMNGWLALTLQRLSVPADKTRRMVATSVLGLFGWLLISGALAYSGFLAQWDARPPHLAVIPLVALIAVVLIHRASGFRRLIEITPRHWPVAMESFRIGVELAFWGLFLAGGAPTQVTFEGRNFDVLVGLSAPLIALAIMRFKLSPRWVIVWNVAGLGILFNTIITTFTSTPGPLHLNWPGEPFTAFATWPFVWIPGLLAPLAIFLHLFSIRQNAALIRQNKAPEGLHTKP